MKKIELLSPAKNLECGLAAINHGAILDVRAVGGAGERGGLGEDDPAAAGGARFRPRQRGLGDSVRRR